MKKIITPSRPETDFMLICPFQQLGFPIKNTTSVPLSSCCSSTIIFIVLAIYTSFFKRPITTKAPTTAGKNRRNVRCSNVNTGMTGAGTMR